MSEPTTPDVSQYDAALSAWIDAHRDEMVASLQGLLKIPSLLADAQPDAPFGPESRRALDYTMALAEQYGLATKVVDGYAGHAEYGTGEEIIGVLAHVDVVPVGNGWTRDPFGGEVVDGKIFGRGAIDDKGPTIAGLYAIFALKQCGIETKKRIRAIIGTDEETGFRCVHHYFEHEEMPVFGFTPDGSFPAIYAEKGIAKVTLSASLPSGEGALRLISINGGDRSNMVPDLAEAVLSFEAMPIVPLQERLEKFEGIETEVNIDRLTVRAKGVNAHGSTPELGVNAVARLTAALASLEQLGAPVLVTVKSIHAVAADTTGGALGIAGQDDVAGPLTSNLGVIATDDERLHLTFSVRYPVTLAGDDVKAKLHDAAQSAGFTLDEFVDAKPLYVPQDDPDLATLLAVYRAETGDLQPPRTTGGGTYARALKKGVAFGADFPGFPMLAHQADEYWLIEDMLKATKIYAKALVRLTAST